MRDYLVVTWWLDTMPMRCYKEFDELKDAQEYADMKAEALRKKGFDYDVAIYERTNH